MSRASSPVLALFTPGDDPLLYYRTIIRRSDSWLRPGGWLVFESHRDFARHLEQLLAEGPFVRVGVRRDLAGNDRIVLAQKMERKQAGNERPNADL